MHETLGNKCIDILRKQMMARSDGTSAPWWIPRAFACCGHMAHCSAITHTLTFPTCSSLTPFTVPVIYLALLVHLAMDFIVFSVAILLPSVVVAPLLALFQVNAPKQVDVAPSWDAWKLFHVSNSPRSSTVISISGCLLTQLIFRDLRCIPTAPSAPSTPGFMWLRCLGLGRECVAGTELAEGALPALALPLARPRHLLRRM